MRRLIPAAASAATLGAILFGCNKHADSVAPAPEPSTWAQQIDWDEAGDEAAHLLSGYLQVDTTNPPGNETLGAQYLTRILAREGISSQIVEYAPGRGSLIARLPGSGQEAPICLMSHIDVVTAEREFWDKDPLGGEIDEDGVIWGRGALDMKGMGLIEVMAMVWMKRTGVPLKRDVILLAVADEEVAGGGARYIADEYWGEIGCSHMINEGGYGLKEDLFEGLTVWAISVAEKGAVWMKVHASGEPGHGSTPRAGSAPFRLIDAMNELQAYEPEPDPPEALIEFFQNIGQKRTGIEGVALRNPRLFWPLLKGQLMDNPVTRAAMVNTIHITGMEGAFSPNVVPAVSSANIDSRILPGVSVEEQVARIEGLVSDHENVSFEVLHSFPAAGNDWDDPFYEAIVRHVEGGRDDAVAGPVVSIGFTDSIYFRPLGVKAYGLVPFEINGAELSTTHGNNERVSSEQVQRGLQLLFEILVDVSAEE